MLCKHIGVCGGCSSQEIPYNIQLEEKQKKIEALFPGHFVEPIVGSLSPWHYRSKMEFTFSEDRAGNQYLGLMKARGRVENLDECLIASTSAGEILASVRQWWKESGLKAYYPRKDEGSLLNLTLRSGKNEMVILTVSGNPSFALNRRQIEGFKKAVGKDGRAIFLMIRRIAKGTPTEFYEMHLDGPAYLEQPLLGLDLRISPQAFFQPNVKLAEKMFQRGMEMLALSPDDKVLDLYCGIGTIGMTLSRHVRQVIGIELSSNSICDARENLERLAITNMHVYQGDAGKKAREILRFFEPDVIVVDPPRSGLDKVSKELLLEVKPKKILYISCNPETQARDLQELSGYSIKGIAPFDQFPHTPHVENIVLAIS